MSNPIIQDSTAIRRVPECQQDLSESCSEEVSSSDDSDDNWKKSKRGKRKDPLSPCGANGQGKDPIAKRQNDIWTNALQEQTLSEDIHTLDVIHTGSETIVKRQCESYRYVVDNKSDRKDRLLSKRRNKRHFRKVKDRNRRRTPVKERLGLKMDTDEMAIVAIAAVLKEPKTDLISKVVTILGKEKALQYMSETQKIEAAGGMLTSDGKRRRTPGGVYFNLLKTDPEVTKDKKQLVFEEDKKKFQNIKRKSRAAERKLKIQKQRAMLAEAEKEESGDKPLPTVVELALQNATVKMEIEREPGEVTD